MLGCRRGNMVLISWKMCCGVHHFLAALILASLSETKQCGYRLYTHDPWSTDHSAPWEHLPTAFGFKDCPWGCCWDQKDDVCCSFPMKVVILGFTAGLSVIVIISVIACVLYYKATVRRRASAQYLHEGTPGIRQSTTDGAGNHIYPNPSIVVEQTYSCTDPEDPPPPYSKA